MLFKRAVKPACEVLVTTAQTEVKTLVNRIVDETLDLLEAGILIVGLIASVAVPHKPVERLLSGLSRILF